MALHFLQLPIQKFIHWILSWFRNCSTLASHFLTTASYFLSFSPPHSHLVALLCYRNFKIFTHDGSTHVYGLQIWLASQHTLHSFYFVLVSSLFHFPQRLFQNFKTYFKSFLQKSADFILSRWPCLYISVKIEVIKEVSLNFSVNISIVIVFLLSFLHSRSMQCPHQFKANPHQWPNSISLCFCPVLALSIISFSTSLLDPSLSL